MRSRPGRCTTAVFTELDALAAELAGHRVILDGELVCLDRQGKPDFHLLRPRISGSPGARATFVAFDVLHLDDLAVRQLPCRERQAILPQVLPARGPATGTHRVPEAQVGDASR